MPDQINIATDHKNSVKKNELLSQPFVFWLPQRNEGALPPELPAPSLTPMLGLYPNERDRVLISTVYHESMWASVIGIQASRFAVSGWELEGSNPRLQADVQKLLLNATVGIIPGWVPFASAGMSSMCNVGKWFIEVERYTSLSGSRVKALHHLDPSRCWLSTDPERPVYYIDRVNQAHELLAHQVIVLMDQPDLTELYLNSPVSAGVRAYKRIVELAALDTYIYEKVSGRRPLAINFVQGLNSSNILDIITKAEAEADQKGAVAYMGSIMAGIMGDIPLNLVTVPLAEIPDGIDADTIRKSCHLTYANALGDDPAGIDPALIGNRQLGAGTQATVLDERASRGGVTNVLKSQWVHAVNNLLRDVKIQFAFIEKDLRDQRAAAEVAKIRADTRGVQVQTGEITAQQATNIAVDAGDLPDEFLIQDMTEGATIADSDNPEMAQEAQNGQAPQPETDQQAAPDQQPLTPEQEQAATKARREAEKLVRSTTEAAKTAFKKAKRAKR